MMKSVYVHDVTASCGDVSELFQIETRCLALLFSILWTTLRSPCYPPNNRASWCAQILRRRQGRWTSQICGCSFSKMHPMIKD